MPSPLNFSGGSYGTHSSSDKGGKTRQRRNPADYGPFSSPHGSIDDPSSFPPYAELPFTSRRRRKQLQDTNSFVKWAMRGVLLSPVVVLVLWSIGAILFTNTHSIGQSRRNNQKSYSNRRQSQQNRQIIPNYFGNNANSMSAGGIPQQQVQQQLQDQQGNMIYNVNGNAMMMASPQMQQQMQVMNNGKASPNNILMTNGYQQQVEPLQVQPQGKPIPVIAPLGNGQNSDVVPSNNLQQGQQPYKLESQQVGASIAAQPQQAFMSTNQNGVVQTTGILQQPQQQQMSQVNLDSSASNVAKQLPITGQGASQQLQQLPLNGLENNNMIQAPPAAMQQLPNSSGSTQDQLQASPAKQAIYFYDPKGTKMSETGAILQMPNLVYDGNGNAIPLEELRYKAPIYVQAPIRGASLTDTINIEVADGGDTESGQVLLSSPSRGASLLSPSAREASIPMPQSWGTSTSQDQTIIVATVAVMALLVGALSARRLRSKSFLSACIENESLEDDIAFDDAYTTTAAASGAMGADSSYNTFGGWKGDLEKFDV